MVIRSGVRSYTKSRGSIRVSMTTRLGLLVGIVTISMALSGCAVLAHVHNFRQDKRMGKIENRLDSLEGNAQEQAQ